MGLVGYCGSVLGNTVTAFFKCDCFTGWSMYPPIRK